MRFVWPHCGGACNRICHSCSCRPPCCICNRPLEIGRWTVILSDGLCNGKPVCKRCSEQEAEKRVEVPRWTGYVAQKQGFEQKKGPLTKCPICHCVVRKDRLARHLRRVHGEFDCPGGTFGVGAGI